MGLDTTHDCWHGAYSAFMRWRIAIAKVVGIDLPKKYGMPDWDNGRNEKREPEEWTEEDLRDPLIVLLNHSDCDGYITWWEAGPLADRLQELLPEIDNLGDGGGHIGDFGAKTRQFIEGLRVAYTKKETVEFH